MWSGGAGERKLYQMRLQSKDGRENILNINCDELAWFKTSPEAGDPDCICSYCGFVIWEWPIRFSHSCELEDCDYQNKEARLHLACFRLLAK